MTGFGLTINCLGLVAGGILRERVESGRRAHARADIVLTLSKSVHLYSATAGGFYAVLSECMGSLESPSF